MNHETKVSTSGLTYESGRFRTDLSQNPPEKVTLHTWVTCVCASCWHAFILTFSVERISFMSMSCRTLFSIYWPIFSTGAEFCLYSLPTPPRGKQMICILLRIFSLGQLMKHRQSMVQNDISIPAPKR